MDEEVFCEEELQDLVLDLINRQKAEIEKLKGSTIVSNIMESQRIKREAKAEAYKEFAEIIKDKWFDNRYDSPDADFDDFISNLLCPQCERKRYIYTIPDIPPSLNKYAGRENVWAYRADKKQWQALCAVYCRPKPNIPIKKCVVRITYFFRTQQRHDPDNYSGKFILDGLREAGIIEDDSFSNVELHLCGAYDKENPRTEIMIKER